jgi:hypothetical protein
MAGKNSSRTREPSTSSRMEPPDAYTPPGAIGSNDPNVARYLITDYDTPLDPTSQEHSELLLALHEAAKAFRKTAMKWRDDIDWSGTTGEQSEADIERRFTRADYYDKCAKLLLDEYRRGVRREWIATFPRKGKQYPPEVYASWKAHGQMAATAAKAARR